ncbi:MAG: S53 family peptidase [Isosphaeraceae bacterium]
MNQPRDCWKMRKRRARRYPPRVEVLDDRRLLSGYTPAQITAAYGLNMIRFTTPGGSTVAGDGSGQTIAIVDLYHDPALQASLNAFDVQYGLPPITVTVNNQAGNQINDAWSGEETLDVEWAHAIAPGARLLVVEVAPGSSDQEQFNNMLAAVRSAAGTTGVSVVSMSWGYSEFSGETTYDSAFTAAGVTFIASAGDYGQVTWPSCSPDVLAVGGTTLTLTASGAYSSEAGWSSTGGGMSTNESVPSYQATVNPGGARSTPDVAFVADPATGVSVYYVPPENPAGAGQWTEVGGTSIGSPAWAGLIAIADQGRALGGHSSLTGSTQTLPAIYALPNADFYKVPLTAPGGNSSTNTAINTPNYNTQTGLGTPAGSSLILALVNASVTAPTPTPTPLPTPTPTTGPGGLQPPVSINPPQPVSGPGPVSASPVPAPPVTTVPISSPSPTPPPASPPVAAPLVVRHRPAMRLERKFHSFGAKGRRHFRIRRGHDRFLAHGVGRPRKVDRPAFLGLPAAVTPPWWNRSV